MIGEITEVYDNSNKQVHVLVELDKRQFERYQTNSIILSGLKKKNNKHPYYSNIEIGDNLKLSKQNHDGYIFDMIRLLITKKQFILILGLRKELELYVEKLFCYPCNNSFYIKEDKNKSEILSGYVILMIGKIPNIQKSPDDFWDEEFETLLKKNKTNIMNNQNHFGSSGQYYAFGNKGSYKKIINESSVDLYSNKGSDDNCQKIETKGYVEIRRSIKLLSSMIPNINKFVSSIIDAGYDNQKIVGSNDLKLLPIKDSGCWNMYICCNAQTKEFHSENDVGYTLISVPNQNIPSFKKTPTFLFKLNEKKVIGLELTNEISFLYSGLFLEHRQAMTSDQDKNFHSIMFYHIPTENYSII